MTNQTAALAAIPEPGATARAIYTEATDATFRAAVAQLAKSLPSHHAELLRLVDEGQFHDIEAILAVLDRGAQ